MLWRIVLRRGIDFSSMAEIVNLRRARKDKARRERDGEAAANRRRFGRTKAEKKAEQDAEDRARRSLDGKLIERDEP